MESEARGRRTSKAGAEGCRSATYYVLTAGTVGRSREGRCGGRPEGDGRIGTTERVRATKRIGRVRKSASQHGELRSSSGDQLQRDEPRPLERVRRLSAVASQVRVGQREQRQQ